MHEMHRRGLLLQMSYIAWSVCLCVGHDSEPCKNGWTDRDARAVLGYRTRVVSSTHVLDEVPNIPWKVAILKDAVGCHIKFFLVKIPLVVCKATCFWVTLGNLDIFITSIKGWQYTVFQKKYTPQPSTIILIVVVCPIPVIFRTNITEWICHQKVVYIRALPLETSRPSKSHTQW